MWDVEMVGCGAAHGHSSQAMTSGSTGMRPVPVDVDAGLDSDLGRQRRRAHAGGPHDDVGVDAVDSAGAVPDLDAALADQLGRW